MTTAFSPGAPALEDHLEANVLFVRTGNIYRWVFAAHLFQALMESTPHNVDVTGGGSLGPGRRVSQNAIEALVRISCPLRQLVF